MNGQLFTVPESRRVRYIVHTDCKNEADDQYTVVHCLLTQMLDVKGIIAAHFNTCFGRYEDGTTHRASFDEIETILEKMNLKGQYPVYLGAPRALPDEHTPIDSAGAQFIISEALKEDPRPLYIGLQGSITDLASAILMKPEICSRMTAIWIGGAPYPEGGEEFNLMQDVAAANVVFASDMPLWQVPSHVYKTFSITLAMLQRRVKPCGAIGEYLFEELTQLNEQLCAAQPTFDWPHGEVWGLGDEGVVAALLHEKQRTDMYHYVPAPVIDPETMKYLPSKGAREIRVYDRMDDRMIVEDLLCKLELFAEQSVQ